MSGARERVWHVAGCHRRDLFQQRSLRLLRVLPVQGVPKCWMFLHKLCHLYYMLVRQTTTVSVVLLEDIGLHQTTQRLPKSLGLAVSTFEGSKMWSLFNNLMRLFSEARQEHPAVGGELAFVPREHPVKWMWTTSGGRTRLFPTASAMVHHPGNR